MCLNAEKEYAIRLALADKVGKVSGSAIEGLGSGDNVFETPFYFANREDFAATVGISTPANIKALEIKFAQVHFLNFIDTGGGTDECPELHVNYDVMLYRQFIQIRGDMQGSRPYNDYIAWVMNMMRAFFVNRELTDEARIISFSQPVFISVNAESDYMPGEKGIFSTLRATLEVK